MAPKGAMEARQAGAGGPSPACVTLAMSTAAGKGTRVCGRRQHTGPGWSRTGAHAELKAQRGLRGGRPVSGGARGPGQAAGTVSARPGGPQCKGRERSSLGPVHP